MTGGDIFIYLYFSPTRADGVEWCCERQQSSDVYKGVHERERSRSQCRYPPSQTNEKAALTNVAFSTK